MLKKILINRWKESFLTLVVLAVMAGTSYGAVYNLRADVTTKIINGDTIPMWGFADDTAGPGTVMVPGPTLTVPPGEDLTVNLTNYLPVPVSIVIPGQSITPAPTYDGGRVMSFTNEAAAYNAGTGTPGTATYTWASLKPGTYIYQSGTNPAVQVQMGLYGAVKKDTAAGEAYTGKTYDAEAIVLFSEIDADLHHSIATGNYTGIPAQTFSGYTPPTVIYTFTSTIDYWPRYFLINGEGFQPPSLFPDVGGPFTAGQKVLIRMLNAGLQTHAPTLLGSHISLIAEDGNAYLYAREQYSVNLSAGKTIDAIFTPAAPGDYPVLDRRLNVTNAGASPGGMIAKLIVGAADAPPVAYDDSYSTFKNTPLNVAAPGVLVNDTNPGTGTLSAALVSGTEPTNGALTFNPNGSFTYTPNTGYSGTDSFQYTATDGGGTSSPATVTITIINNDPPTAVDDDPYLVDEDNTLNVAAPGVLENDSDPNLNPLIAVLVSGPANGTLSLNANGSFSYKPNLNYNGSDSFSYKANDGLQDSNVATVTITINPVNDPPVAVNDFASTPKNKSVSFSLVANDTDVDGTIVVTSVTITTPPNRGGTVTVTDGVATYTPKKNFRGTEVFYYKVWDNLGLPSNVAKVTVNVK